MAKQPAAQQPAPPASGELAPYPKQWAKMSKDDRQKWMKVNRPNRATGVPAKPAAPPPPPPPPAAAAPGGAQQTAAEGKQLVQIDVSSYMVRVGTREPVECGPDDVVDTVDKELRAWEDQNQGEGEGDQAYGQGEE